jgi:hypothetical protein
VLLSLFYMSPDWQFLIWVGRLVMRLVTLLAGLVSGLGALSDALLAPGEARD